MNAQTKAVLASWGKVFAAAVLTYVLAGLTAGTALDPKAVLVAGLVATLPVIINWLSPNDPRYGVGYVEPPVVSAADPGRGGYVGDPDA